MNDALKTRRQQLDHALEKYGFRSLHDLFDVWRRTIETGRSRLGQEMRRGLERRRRRLEAASGAYGLREWPRQIATRRADRLDLHQRLAASLRARLDALGVRARGYADRLRALSPRLVLERGYCLVRGKDGRLLRAAARLSVGDPITVEFARGEADARIEAVRRGEEHGP
jgi:exodeoxyribonuclease VII large subunit